MYVCHGFKIRDICICKKKMPPAGAGSIFNPNIYIITNNNY